LLSQLASPQQYSGLRTDLSALEAHQFPITSFAASQCEGVCLVLQTIGPRWKRELDGGMQNKEKMKTRMLIEVATGQLTYLILITVALLV
jgi:hypothetical protein